MCKISGIVIEHGKDDFGYWEGFSLTEAEENAIWNILNKHDTEGCSITDTAKMIRREIMETYSNEEIRGLNGFFLTKSELDIDTAGLEKEIEDIMKHPRKYKAMIMVFAYFRNMMIKE